MDIFQSNDSHNVSTDYQSPTFYDNGTRATNQYKDIENILMSYVTGSICFLGLLGNILNLVILTRKSLITNMERMEKSAHTGLIALAVSDFLFCLTTLPHSWVDKLNQFDFDSIDFWIVYKVYGVAVINIFLLSSTWLTVAMAVSRYIAICHPLRARQYIGQTGTRVTIILTFLLSILFNLPRFWSSAILYIDFAGVYMADEKGPLTLYKEANLAYFWIYFVLGILLPLIVLAYSNIFLIRALKQSSRMRQQHTRPTQDRKSDSKTVVTLTLTVIIIFYIILVLPAELLNFFKDFVVDRYTLPKSYNLAVVVCNTLQAVNFAFNFCLYCIINANFRKAVGDLICCRSASTHGGVRYTSVQVGGASSQRTTMSHAGRSNGTVNNGVSV